MGSFQNNQFKFIYFYVAYIIKVLVPTNRSTAMLATNDSRV